APASASANLQSRAPDIVTLSWNGTSVDAFRNQLIVQLPNISGPAHSQIAMAQDRFDNLPQTFYVMKQLGSDGMFLVDGTDDGTMSDVTSLLAPINCTLIEPNIAG